MKPAHTLDREQMSHEQLVAAINVQLNNVIDNTLPLQLQTMCCKLLMNLVQALAGKPIAIGSDRNLLVRILQAFVAKLGSLRRVQFARVLEVTQHSAPTSGGGDETTKPSGADEDVDAEGDGLLLGTASSALTISHDHAPAVYTELDTQRFLLPIPTDQISVAYSDGVKDCRFLLKNMISGLKVLELTFLTCVGEMSCLFAHLCFVYSHRCPLCCHLLSLQLLGTFSHA